MKNSSLWIRTAIILVITLIAIYMVFGPRQGFSSSDLTWEGVKRNLANNISLGLDLKGGSHLLMHVKTDEYLLNLTKDNKEAMVNTAKQAKLEIEEATYIAEKGNYKVSVIIPDASKTEETLEAIKKKGIFDINWVQTTSGNTLNWTLPLQAQKVLSQQASDQVLKIIDSRINSFGIKEPTLQKVGSPDSGQILLQMPGVEDPERVKKLIGEVSKLELVKVVSPPSPNLQTYPTKEAALQAIGGKDTDSQKVFPYFERDERNPASAQDPQNKQPSKFVVVEYPAVVDGGELRDASAIPQAQNSNQYTISFAFKPTGAQKFGDWTGKNINNYMGVVLNKEVKSIAYIKSQIFDQGQIDGRFTKDSANDLVLTLKSGALPATIEYQEERTVGPSLGADSIRAGVSASLGGLAFVVCFMLIYYRGSGVNAVVALILNMVLTMAGLIWLGSTLTLPGIAGLILGIGMAVDSNVLIFERIREELRKGVAVPKSVDLGFEHAFVTIIDTHVTTIISSVILYMYGSGPIKGFAVTLILGLLINLFSAVFVSRTIFRWHLDGKQKVESLSI